MTVFTDVYRRHDFQEVARDIASQDEDRARAALDRFEDELSLDDFRALISPAAGKFLEEMAQKARYITRKRFGNTMQLYAPLYLSNECFSDCTYCGFRFANKTPRLTLSPEEAVREADHLYDQGIRHILLLTGEAYRATPPEYIADVSRRLAQRFTSIGIEVYPLKTEEYASLRENGVDALTIYQETYDPVRYREVHLKGVKSRLEYRLECPDRAGAAQMRRINIGALLGLSDPAAEVFYCALHARYLLKRYWRTQISVSLPRLRPAAGFASVPELSDRRFTQYLCALRIFLPDIGLTLSTRESPYLRDHLSPICITNMSAGSRTDPGGYSNLGAEEQFSIEDKRDIAAIRAMLERNGLEALFVDWTPVMK